MCKESGQPIYPALPGVRKRWGIKVWEEGDLFRPGKTRREEASGQKARYLQNVEARREENRYGGPKKKK